MTASIVVIDSDAIRQIWKTVNPSHFVKIPRKTTKIAESVKEDKATNQSRFLKLARTNIRAANLVKKHWNNLSIEDREFLKSFAYDLIEPPTGLSRLWSRLRAEVYTIFIKVTGQEEEFCLCIQSLDYLIDSILDAIEREHPYYEQILSDTLEEVISSLEVEELIDGKGQSGQWLQQLSDQALNEI